MSQKYDDSGAELDELVQGERAWFDKPQDTCPKCDSDDIANHGPPEDGRLDVTCDGCGLQWSEPNTE